MQKYTDVVQDRNGNVVVGATVTVTDYPSGTSSTVYSANVIGSNANPLTTDSTGRFTFYAKDGNYTLTVTKTGITTQTHRITVQETVGVAIDVKGYGALGDGTTDDTTAIQAAITAGANGTVFFPPGSYKITSAINIVNSCKIFAHPFSATVYLATQNQNGFVIGDGTAPTALVSNSVTIQGLQFAPFTGVSASTSGAAISVNEASFFVIDQVSVSGSISSVAKIFNGIAVSQGIEWKIKDCIISGVVNNGVRVTGTSGVHTTDGRIDYSLFTHCGSDCIYFGDYTAAITVTSPIMYSNTGWGVRMDCTASAGVGFNYFIFQPDIEVTTATSALGGIYAKQCVGAQIIGGWVGGVPGLQVDSTGSSVFSTGVTYQIAGSAGAAVTLTGASCSLTGCDIVGDSSTTTTGVSVASTGTDTAIVGCRIRQWTTAGVAYASSPARCTLTANTFRSNTANVTGLPSDINATAFPTNTTTPTPTANSGTFTSVTGALAYTKESNRIDVDITVTITTNGSAAGFIKVPLPFTPAAVQGGLSGNDVSNGKALSGYFNTDGTAVIVLYDGTYPGADGKTLRVGGFYRV